MPQLLVEDRLHLWHFFNFKGDKYLGPIESIEHLIEEIDYPNIKKFAFTGYQQLLSSLQKFLTWPEGQALFLVRTQDKLSKSDADMLLQADKQRQFALTKHSNVQKGLSGGNPYGEFITESKAEADLMAKFKNTFEGTRQLEAPLINCHV